MRWITKHGFEMLSEVADKPDKIPDIAADLIK